MKRKAIVVAVLLLVAPLATAAVATGTASAITIPGISGFITSDGLFFVQVGYSQFGYTTYVGNGSDVYASAIVINVTGITTTSQVAHVSVYEYADRRTVQNVNVPIPGYSSVAVAVDLPQNHTYMEYKVSVDSTPWWVYAYTPWSFLGFTGLQDGGADLASVPEGPKTHVYVGVGPLALKDQFEA